MRSLAFHGTLIHSATPSRIKILHDALIVIDEHGTIISCKADIPRDEVLRELDKHGTKGIRYLEKHDFLIPGFVDTHNHAPQYGQRGLGQGLHILNWLDQLTFPNEAKFGDVDYARRMYERCVDGFLKQGITTASYYGSLHGPATKILAEICLEKGQRALVGKCNMNRNSPAYYVEGSAEESLQQTEDFINHVHGLDKTGELVRPILTPRFAISCDDALLAGLGKIAAAHPDMAIQTHFNEAKQEIDATLALFPAFTNEADLYEHFGLLTTRTILAHCTIMNQKNEIDKLASLGCGVAHCPIANTTIGGGFMAAPIREFLRHGIRVGLGTDSGGGFSSSILDVIRQAMIVSNAREMQSAGRDGALSLDELFHLATLGGASVCGLHSKIGSLEVGKQFDALVVRPNEVVTENGEVVRALDGVMTAVEEGDDARTVWEKFLVSGDDRNIEQVYVKGRLVSHRVSK
jgi:guanine deaminase